MKPNPVKRLLQQGGTVIGSEISRLRSADVARIYATAGFDFVFIDMEHSSFNLETVADMIQSARYWNIVPVVRVPQAEYAYVARVLDAGAQGVIVPRVNTPREVEQIASWVRYPPHGVRGFACTTSQVGAELVEAGDFIAHNDRESLLVIQIERREAVENLVDMLSIDGVDVACLGLMDLTVDMGIPGDVRHPRAVEAIERLLEVTRQRNMAAGIITADLDLVHTWAARGVRFISYATEEILLQQAATRAVQQLTAQRRGQVDV
jgi:2-keto-3-deoxy-L-rhamnonate aldolase RhmA